MANPMYRYEEPGPFEASHIREGDRYELSNGHPIYCSPTGGDGARGSGVGFGVLDTDPVVDSAGIDPGFTPSGPRSLRAPDIGIGNIPDRPGWIPGAPLLAVEYASSGQDEPELQRKIIELLNAGTKLIWVVRLLGIRRVEVYEKGLAPKTFYAGHELRADGILHNPVPVQALYDRTLAHELTLRNLLQRKGYESVAQILEKGLEKGREEGLEKGREEGLEKGREEGREAMAETLLALLRARGLPVDDATVGRVRGCRANELLRAWMVRAGTAATVDEVFAETEQA